MAILLRMAVRNLIEHRGKTLIIGTIIAIGVAVLLIGNALMDTASLGIQRSFIDNYTGHIMVSGTSSGEISLFGVQTVGGIDPTPIIPDFSTVFDIVSRSPGVSGITSQLTGFGLLRREADENDDPDAGQETRNSTFTLLFGIEPESYQTTFSNFEILHGRYLLPGEQGIMISTDRIREMYKDFHRAQRDRVGVSDESESTETKDPTDQDLIDFLGVGDRIRILGGFNQGLPRIRVLPVVGIYEQANEAKGVGSDLITFIDAQSLRALLNLNVSIQGAVSLRDEETSLLRSFDSPESGGMDVFSDDLFGSFDDLFLESEDLDGIGDPFALFDDEIFSESPAEAVPDETTISQVNSGSWHYILVRLENGNRADRVINQINQDFRENNIDAVAGNWEKAAGPFAQTADVIRTVFNVAIIIIGVVAILIMMNTMVISVIERTGEIGTMRALGAQRSTIRSLFLIETLVITTIFGIVGILLGLLITGVLNIVGVPATNTFLEVLFAGPVLRPRISVLSLVYSLVIVSGIGILAHLYPVSVAVKIQPVRAMQSE